MSIFRKMRIVVTDHAVYQFALRFASETPTDRESLRRHRRVIEQEVRAALEGRRFSTEKPSSLHPPSDPSCLYAWTSNEQRIYSLRHDESPPQFVVTTTMRAEREVVA